MDDFVSFEISKKLKLSGFRDGCIATYNCSGELFYNKYDLMYSSDVPFVHSRNSLKFSGRWDSPTISQVLKWLREEKNIHIEIWWQTQYTAKNLNGFQFVVTPICENPQCETDLELYCDYETAALKGIEYVIDNLI